MMDDVAINKIQTIRRCLARINEEYNDEPANLRNYTKQDSIVLNLQRACEACIDLAMHAIAQKGLDIPQSSRDAFDILQENHIIDEATAVRMKAMVGFRNIAIHDYQALNLEIVQTIIEKHLGDFEEFIRSVVDKELLL